MPGRRLPRSSSHAVRAPSSCAGWRPAAPLCGLLRPRALRRAAGAHARRATRAARAVELHGPLKRVLVIAAPVAAAAALIGVVAVNGPYGGDDAGDAGGEAAEDVSQLEMGPRRSRPERAKKAAAPTQQPRPTRSSATSRARERGRRPARRRGHLGRGQPERLSDCAGNGSRRARGSRGTSRRNRRRLRQVEVERVEELDGRARRVHGDVRRDVEERLGVVEDDLDAGIDDLVRDVLGGVGRDGEHGDDDVLLADDVPDWRPSRRRS